MPSYDGFGIGEGPADEDRLFGFAVPDAECLARDAGVKADPPAAAAGEVDEGAVVDDLSQMDVAGGDDGIEAGAGVEGGDVDVAEEGGEDEASAGEDDAGDGAGEVTQNAVMVGEAGADVEAGGEVEEADGAVDETHGEVEVGEGEAAAGEIWVGVSWVKIQHRIVKPAVPEIHGGAVAVDELFPPRVMKPPRPSPDAAAEVAP